MSRRPVLSPGRVEKYPPPLMRFLRSSSSGGGSRSRSRSRGRSRSSPLFVRRSKSSSSSSAAAAAAAQEPSSPKVTCMGQVRVRRSKPQTRETKPGSHGNPTRRCKWIQNALFYRPFAGKLKTWSFSGTWPKWASFSFPNFRGKPKRMENSPRNEPGSGIDPNSVRENGRQSQEGEDEWRNNRNPRLFASPASTPPRNSLFLTRSRSAPYRSSSLAFRFWESDNQRETEEPNSREEEENEEEEEEEEEGQRNFRSEGESISRNSIQDTEAAGKIEGLGETESSIEEKEAKSEKKEEEETSEVGIVRTPVLGRSKSGPARIGEKMVRGWLLDEEEG